MSELLIKPSRYGTNPNQCKTIYFSFRHHNLNTTLCCPSGYKIVIMYAKFGRTNHWDPICKPRYRRTVPCCLNVVKFSDIGCQSQPMCTLKPSIEGPCNCNTVFDALNISFLLIKTISDRVFKYNTNHY